MLFRVDSTHVSSCLGRLGCHKQYLVIIFHQLSPLMPVCGDCVKTGLCVSRPEVATCQRRWIQLPHNQWEASSHSLWWWKWGVSYKAEGDASWDGRESFQPADPPSQVYQTEWKRIRGRTEELASSCQHSASPSPRLNWLNVSSWWKLPML